MYDQIGFHMQNRRIVLNLREALGGNNGGETIQGVAIDEPDLQPVLPCQALGLGFNVTTSPQLYDVSIRCRFRPSWDRPHSHSLPEQLRCSGKNY